MLKRLAILAFGAIALVALCGQSPIKGFPPGTFQSRAPIDAASGGGGGTVTFDASTGLTTAHTTGTSLTFSMTVGSGSQRGLEVFFWTDSSIIVPTGLACTWDTVGTNQSMTIIPNTTTAANGGITAASANFGLIAPTSGSKTGTCTWIGSVTAYISAASFTGVNQGSIAAAFPNGNTVSFTTATASPISLTVTSATNHIVVASFCQTQSTWGAISGTTIVNDIISGTFCAFAANQTAGAASVTATAAFTGPGGQIASGNDISP